MLEGEAWAVKREAGTRFLAAAARSASGEAAYSEGSGKSGSPQTASR